MVQLRLENLESRLTPSTVLVDSDGDSSVDKVQITGDDSANCVTIRQDDQSDKLTIIDGAVTTVVASSKIRTITADLRDGDDCLTYRLDSDFAYRKALWADLGMGNDQALLTARVQMGNIVSYKTIRAVLQANVVAGRGMDRVETDLGRLSNGQVSMQARLGGEADQFSSTWRGDLVGMSRVDFDIDGESGNDQLDFQALAELDGSGIDILGAASLAMRLRGGLNDDIVSARYSGVVDGGLVIDLYGGWGNDELLTDCTLRTGSDGWLIAHSFGDDGDDQVTAKLYDHSAGSADGGFVLDGGAGYDCASMYGDTSWMSWVNFECVYLQFDDWGVVVP